MGRDALAAEHIGPLVEEHRELAGLLATADLSDPTDQERIRVAVFELHEHIAKEEDGLFPASLIALGGDEWDASMVAWQAAHPGQTMIGELRARSAVLLADTQQDRGVFLGFERVLGVGHDHQVAR